MKPSSILPLAIPLLLVAGGAYWYLSSQAGNAVPLTENGSAGSPMQVQFQSLVDKLSSISFDTGILSDPHFAALVDLATPITPEPAGRVDPFAAIAGVNGKR